MGLKKKNIFLGIMVITLFIISYLSFARIIGFYTPLDKRPLFEYQDNALIISGLFTHEQGEEKIICGVTENSFLDIYCCHQNNNEDTCKNMPKFIKTDFPEDFLSQKISDNGALYQINTKKHTLIRIAGCGLCSNQTLIGK